MMTLRERLVHAAAGHDRKEASKRSAYRYGAYNRYAPAQYFARIEEVIADAEDGAPVRDAVVAAFSGRLLDKMPEAAGVPPAAPEDRCGTAFYEPVAE
jgi:hypothetical protein